MVDLKTKGVRNSNFELYRIIVMFMIVCHHYVMNSGLMELLPQNQFSLNSIFYYLFGMWGKTGINSFVLITGYFMCTSKITLRKFLKMYLQIIFYALLFWGMFIFMGHKVFSLKDMFFELTPFWKIHSDSFVSAFIIWWLFIPFLSVLVNNIRKTQHLYLVSMCIFLFSLFPMLPFTTLDVNPICWFSTLFFIASYIRKYPDSMFLGGNTKFWGLATIVSVILSMICVLTIAYLYGRIGSDHLPYGLVCQENRPMALFVAVISFIYFKNLNIRYSLVINTIGATTFGVLLIHTNSSFRSLLFGGIVQPIVHQYTAFYPLYALGCCVIIFIVCSFLDWIRILTIEKYVMAIVDKKLKNEKKKC